MSSIIKTEDGGDSTIAPKRKRKEGDPTKKVEGKIFYLHSKFRKGFPRITIAAHINEEKNELYYGFSICDPRDQFEKRVGRVRALGRAVSTKRGILKLKMFDPKSIREKMALELDKKNVDCTILETLRSPGVVNRLAEHVGISIKRIDRRELEKMIEDGKKK